MMIWQQYAIHHPVAGRVSGTAPPHVPGYDIIAEMDKEQYCWFEFAGKT